MHHKQRRVGVKLDGKIPVRNRVQGVAGNLFKAQLLGSHLAVDGKPGAGQRRASQGGDVYARATFPQALVVALQHFVPGQQMMTKGDRLRALHMGKAGHDGSRLRRGHFHQRPLQRPQPAAKFVQLITQVQPEVGGDLVVARARGVQFLAGVADQLDEFGLDIHMNIFAGLGPVETPLRDLRANGRKAVCNAAEFLRRQHADVGQHSGMGDGRANIVAVQPPIKPDRSGKRLHERVRRSGKSASPGFFFAHLVSR